MVPYIHDSLKNRILKEIKPFDKFHQIESTFSYIQKSNLGIGDLNLTKNEKAYKGFLRMKKKQEPELHSTNKNLGEFKNNDKLGITPFSHDSLNSGNDDNNSDNNNNNNNNGSDIPTLNVHSAYDSHVEIKNEDISPERMDTSQPVPPLPNEGECIFKYKLVDALMKIPILYAYVKDKKKEKQIGACKQDVYSVWFVSVKDYNNFLPVLATLYGFLPLLLVIFIVISYILTFNKTLLFMICIVLTQIIFNDMILKNIFKSQRPLNSALDSYGMPSGHSVLSIGLYSFLFVHFLKKTKTFISWLTIILASILLLPIPWSRVAIEDHSVYQVCTGSFLGLVIGLLYYFIQIKYFR